MWYDVRKVMAHMEMRLQELLSIIKLCPDEAQVMLFVPAEVGEDSMFAREVQQRV